MTRRVVIVDETSAIGGAEVNLLTVAPKLRALGWDPLITMPAPGRLSERLGQLGIAAAFVTQPPLLSSSVYIRHRHKLPNPLALPANLALGLGWAVRLAGFLQRARPALVQSVSMWGHAFASLAAKMAGLPVVWHFQGIVGPRSGLGLYRTLALLCAQWAPDRIICISDLVAEQFRATPRAATPSSSPRSTTQSPTSANAPLNERELATKTRRREDPKDLTIFESYRLCGKY